MRNALCLLLILGGVGCAEVSGDEPDSAPVAECDSGAPDAAPAPCNGAPAPGADSETGTNYRCVEGTWVRNGLWCVERQNQETLVWERECYADIETCRAYLLQCAYCAQYCYQPRAEISDGQAL
jgi:hypothetical protein